ncbi:DMT family transporter [Nordella sp. HKS 07]|uniref:DMT family transporter n=1 Tax=Nordella sp. HKS 07 TaxID=2712222 RepID=UPI0013E1CB16|nr:DMT family transporter [Nordella sp. HKS 07]QIG46705.1 DMT family transporter [Nordella sp. HKS 07]
MTPASDNASWLRAVALMVAAAGIFAMLDGLSKILATEQSVGQIVWARYTFAIPVLLWASPSAEWRALFRTRQRRTQIIRGLIPLCISIMMVLAVRYLPLAEATVILYLGPLLVVALAPALLSETVRLSAWIGVGIGFLAVLIVARPGLSELSLYALFPLAAAVLYSFFQIFTRKLGAAGELPETTLAWTLAIGTIVATPMAVAAWEPLSGLNWLIMIALGFTFGLAQIFTIRAFALAPANRLAPFSYAQIIGAVLFGIVVFGAVPDIWTVLGIGMIIGAGIYVMRSRA